MADAEERFSLRELNMLAGSSIPSQVSIGWLLTRDHAKRLELVRLAIDYIVGEMAKSRHLLQKMSEDQLTNHVIAQLSCMGAAATHDTQYGGHCDIVVETRDGFLWIAESKIHRDYDWLLKGFLQLTTRYSTGNIGQDSGDVIIFMYNERIDIIMENWINHLLSNIKDVLHSIDPKNPLYRLTTHTHQRSGLPFVVRHIPVSLFFKPQDH